MALAAITLGVAVSGGFGGAMCIRFSFWLFEFFQAAAKVRLGKLEVCVNFLSVII